MVLTGALIGYINHNHLKGSKLFLGWQYEQTPYLVHVQIDCNN
jgi:hypothetical protein